jgi:hypothetical protein
MRKYIGGVYKVSIIVDNYNSFEYPSESFRPIKLPVYKIGYDKLGKRYQKVTRSPKMRNKILRELKVEPTMLKDLLLIEF